MDLVELSGAVVDKLMDIKDWIIPFTLSSFGWTLGNIETSITKFCINWPLLVLILFLSVLWLIFLNKLSNYTTATAGAWWWTMTPLVIMFVPFIIYTTFNILAGRCEVLS